jgi:hypothetical protein
MQLYKLAEQYQQAVSGIQAMFDAGDIDLSALTDTLEGMDGEVKDKAINVALHIKNLRSDIDQLKSAKDSFDQRIKQAQSSLDFYEQYLDSNLTRSGITEIKSELVQIKYKSLPAIVEVTGDVPQEYQRVIPEKREPDKIAIAAALKSGQDLGFASLITGRTKLEIK